MSNDNPHHSHPAAPSDNKSDAAAYPLFLLGLDLRQTVPQSSTVSMRARPPSVDIMHTLFSKLHDVMSSDDPGRAAGAHHVYYIGQSEGVIAIHCGLFAMSNRIKVNTFLRSLSDHGFENMGRFRASESSAAITMVDPRRWRMYKVPCEFAYDNVMHGRYTKPSFKRELKVTPLAFESSSDDDAKQDTFADKPAII